MDATDLPDLERRGWQALSTAGAAPGFYDEVLVDDPLMLLPGGMVLTDRAEIVAAMGGPPWDRYELEDMRVVDLGPDAAVVAYGGLAWRGETEVSSLFASTYCRRADGWKLAVHQQTPRTGSGEDEQSSS